MSFPIHTQQTLYSKAGAAWHSGGCLPQIRLALGEARSRSEMEPRPRSAFKIISPETATDDTPTKFSSRGGEA
jgi:hypothetical protein